MHAFGIYKTKIPEKESKTNEGEIWDKYNCPYPHAYAQRSRMSNVLELQRVKRVKQTSKGRRRARGRGVIKGINKTTKGGYNITTSFPASTWIVSLSRPCIRLLSRQSIIHIQTSSL